MRRTAWIFSVISAILLAYGLVDYLTNYNWAQGDQDPLFGNQNILLNDGATVLIAGGFLAAGSVLMWILAVRQQPHRERGVRKESGDHQQP
jgi:hypothetical protein